MNTFKTKSLYAALAGASALGATGAAQAVNINPDGLGQVLIYPYYTTQALAGNAYNSLLSVVNTTNSAKAVKVRFLEGKNSREVLDFNLFLSKNDVWTTAVIPSASGGGRIITNDTSCTIPPIPSGASGGVDFVNFAYTGSNDDKGGSGLDRTREGYVEIIEMATFAPTTTTSINVTHINGTPPGCAAQTDAQANTDQSPASGGLFGGMTLINVAAGTDYPEDAIALENFNQTAFYQPANSVSPQLSDVFPPVSVVFNGTSGVYTSAWAQPIDAVSAVLMHNNVMNEYVLDTATKSGTDWVITMPTKRFYVVPGTGNAPKLFQRNFNTTAGACDDVSLNIFDREERTTSTPVNFSPPPPTLTNSLCWEANVVTFNNSGLLGSVNVANVPTGSFQNGWLRVGFPTGISGATTGVHTLVNTTGAGASNFVTAIGGSTTAQATVTYTGLPVVGFAVQNFNNGVLTVGGATVLSNYGGGFVHKTSRLIQ